MAYKTDGSTHHSGIKAEKDLAEHIQKDRDLALSVFPECPENYTATQLGGTKHKPDIMIGTQGVSVKKKEKLETGSFDWLNSSAAYKKHSDKFPNLNEVYEACRAARATGITRPIDVEYWREQIKVATHKDLESFSADILEDVIRGSIIDPYEDLILTIQDKSSDQIHSCDFRDTLLYKIFEDDVDLTFKKTKTKEPSTSRTVLLNGEDKGLRLRVVLNNGVGALLGLSQRNRDSQLVIKFQQDKVAGFLDDIEPEDLRVASY